jgi:hypothetical protein
MLGSNILLISVIGPTLPVHQLVELPVIRDRPFARKRRSWYRRVEPNTLKLQRRQMS